MNKNPLQNIEAMETLGVVLVGIILLLTLEPIGTARLFFAGILGGLFIVLVAIELWQRLHDRY